MLHEIYSVKQIGWIEVPCANLIKTWSVTSFVPLDIKHNYENNSISYLVNCDLFEELNEDDHIPHYKILLGNSKKGKTVIINVQKVKQQ